jgi:hypothetical protein
LACLMQAFRQLSASPQGSAIILLVLHCNITSGGKEK